MLHHWCSYNLKPLGHSPDHNSLHFHPRISGLQPITSPLSPPAYLNKSLFSAWSQISPPSQQPQPSGTITDLTPMQHLDENCQGKSKSVLLSLQPWPLTPALCSDWLFSIDIKSPFPWKNRGQRAWSFTSTALQIHFSNRYYISPDVLYFCCSCCGFGLNIMIFQGWLYYSGVSTKWKQFRYNSAY